MKIDTTKNKSNPFAFSIGKEKFSYWEFSLLIILITLFVFPSKCIAQEKVDYFELNLDELGKVVVTATKTPRYANLVTQKVDVISLELNQIVSQNRNISEFIQYLPGASVRVLSRNDANWGSYGGIGPKYNSYLLNGIAIDGFIDPMCLSPESIQRIEVQRGPASILYQNYLSQDFAGVQTPLAGTINVVLKENIAEPKTKIKLEYGKFNTISGFLSHENKIGDLSFISGISHELSDYTNYGTSNSWMDMAKDPRYRKTKLFLNSSFKFDASNNHLLRFFVNHTIHSGDIGRETREFDHNYTILNLDYSFHPINQLRLSAKTGFRAYNRSFQNDSKQSTNNIYSLTSTDFIKQNIIPIDISAAYSHLDNSILTFGVDYQIADYQTSNEPIDNSKSTMNDALANNFGIYLQEEFLINNFTIRGGIRYNRTDYKIDQLQGNIPGSTKQHWVNLLWSFGIKYRLSEYFDIFTNTSNSFTPPGLKSSGGTIPLSSLNVSGFTGQLPNPSLKAERGLSLDAGIDFMPLNNLMASGRFFYSSITDAIIEILISQNPSQTMSVNADGETKVLGFEFSLKHQIDNSMNWFGNFTFNNSKITNPDNKDMDDIEIPFVPSIVCNVGFEIFLPYSIKIIPVLTYNSKIYDSNSKKDRNSFETKEIVNIYFSKKFDLDEIHYFDVLLAFNNITNNRFEMPWQFINPGLTYTIGVKTSF